MINQSSIADNNHIDERYVITDFNGAEINTNLVGGKAANLITLKQLRLPVSDFFIITTEAFSAWLPTEIISEISGIQNNEISADDKINQREKHSALLKRLSLCALPHNLEQTILARFDECFTPDGFVSVRSSAVGEDSITDSFAGQLSTFLYVTRAQLLDRIVECFCSNFSIGLMAYRKQRNLLLKEALGAVVIQSMVSSKKSGVLFTADPMSGDTEVIVVTAAYGLGEGVVADLVESDMYCIAKNTLSVLEKNIAIKTKQVDCNVSLGHDTVINLVDEERARNSVLSKEEIYYLSSIAVRIEENYGCPQDIEWAFDENGNLSILQTRPITTIPIKGRSGPSIPSGQKRIFDNSNIIEGYPGVTTPLTFSVVRFCYEIVFKNTAYALGANEKEVRSNHSRFANMVGFIEGRLYYQISNWYYLYQVIPGMAKNIPNWEKSLGLKATDPSKYLTQGLPGVFASVKLNIRLVYLAITLKRRIELFHRAFRQTQQWFSSNDLGALEADALLDVFDQLVDRIIYRWECTTLNDLFVFKYYEMIESQIHDRGLEGYPNLRNDLLANQPGMESVEPVQSILNISDYIKLNPDLLTLFQIEKDNTIILQILRDKSEYSDIYLQIETHLKVYGDRSIEELKFEVPGMGDRPELLIALLKSYLKTQQSTDKLNKNKSDVRIKAEAYVAENLKNKISHKGFTLLLDQCRKAMAERENMRFSRTRAFGMIKKIFRQIGLQFYNQNLINAEDDIFYLSKEEIEGYIRGSATTLSLKELVALRKAEQVKFNKNEPGGRVTTFGTVYNNYFPSKVRAVVDAQTYTLEGIGCSSGMVTGKAKVITNPLEAENFENCILIAEITDPGWVFLMIAAKGIIVERGNVLSHTAIIGRELGIPTVIGVDGATTLIQDGQEISIDGEKGTVILR